MTEKQRKLARHALGLPNKKNHTNRNYFCTDKDTENYPEWQDLVDQGLAVKRERPKMGGTFFYLTLEGAKTVLDRHEHISREDAARMRELSV